jgi:hypothetical protein
LIHLPSQIIQKRPYVDWEEPDMNCLAVIEVNNGTIINGEKIKILFIVSDSSMIPQSMGEDVEIIGKIEFKRIITPSGKRNLSPIPVLKPLQLR